MSSFFNLESDTKGAKGQFVFHEVVPKGYKGYNLSKIPLKKKKCELNKLSSTLR
jgi:hypothetical protein